MRLSVVIPCYNEVNTIDAIIDAVNASPYPDKEIIIVDDCSRDGTREKLKTIIEPSGRVAKVLYHGVNQGKGAALRTGIQGATGDSSSSRTPTWNMIPTNIPGWLSRSWRTRPTSCSARASSAATRTACFTSGTASATAC